MKYSHLSCWTQQKWLGWRSGWWRGCSQTLGLSPWRKLWSQLEDYWRWRRMKKWQGGMQGYSDCWGCCRSGLGFPRWRSACVDEPDSVCEPHLFRRSPPLSHGDSPQCHLGGSCGFGHVCGGCCSARCSCHMWCHWGAPPVESENPADSWAADSPAGDEPRLVRGAHSSCSSPPDDAPYPV